MTAAVLRPILYLEAALAAGLIFTMLIHNAWIAGVRRQHLAHLHVARSIIFEYLKSGDLRSSVAGLRRLPFAAVLQALTEFHRSLAGEEGHAIALLAEGTGVTGHGRVLARSPLWWRRLAGLRAIALSEPGSRALLVGRMLADRDANVRAAAAALTPAHATPEVIAALVTHLGADDTPTRFAVLEALVRCGAPAAAVTADWLRGDATPAAIVAGLLVLERIGDPRGLDLSLRHAAHPDAAVRRQAARTIGAMGDEIALGALTALLHDPDAGVRQMAARSVGRLQWVGLAPELAALLVDPAWGVRRQAAIALRRLGTPGEALLMQALWHTDRYAADMARHILDLPLATVEVDAGA